jgi:hypothetical protein
MNQDLPLRSFEVEGYRGIRHLRLPELARVNLFVGTNNVGKSSLLEAIRMGLQENPSSVAALIYEAVREHTDFSPRLNGSDNEPVLDPIEIESVLAAVESLFSGGFEGPVKLPIRIAGMRRGGRIEVYGPRAQVPGDLDLFGDQSEVFFGPRSRLLTVRTPSETRDIPLRLFIGTVPVRFRHRGDTLRIPAAGLGAQEIREWWDQLAVLGAETLVEDAMRSIWPSFERAVSAGDRARRSVFVKLERISRPVPLQSLGDGMQRVFSIAVALALTSGGALVVDEVENGLHHTAQQEVWDAIFLLAQRLNVQVFATTHSWEAVVAFQRAANRSPETGILYRLEREEDGRLYAERYTEQEVAVAADHDVEVR